MTPFREKPVKWEKGDDYSGRYKNVHGFKFDIIKQTVVVRQETMSEYFLADTPEEAEALYNRYSGLLNALAYNYAISTGLQKDDLFGEALIGLGRAYRDWDIDRSDNFKMYAIYRIKDALNEFARNNMASVTVPAYIKKSHNYIIILKTIFAKYGVSTDTVLMYGKIDKKIKGNDRKECIHSVNNLKKAASRVKAEYKKFVKQVEYIPENCVFNENTISNNHEESLETALMIKKLQTYMDPIELSICQDIMEGISYEQIGKKFDKTAVWVRYRLDKLRDKIIASWS